MSTPATRRRSVPLTSTGIVFIVLALTLVLYIIWW